MTPSNTKEKLEAAIKVIIMLIRGEEIPNLKNMAKKIIKKEKKEVKAEPKLPNKPNED
ncbi:MAG: hypothetical protein ACTSQY_03310 [Candidatus Odinarchaeia archaeon]